MRTDLQERLQDKSDAPAEMRGTLPTKATSSRRKTKLLSIHFLRSGFCRPHPRETPKREREREREFSVDSGASMHMVSKKDLNRAELETVRISKSPTMVMTANGEVLAKEEATVYVRELDLFVTVMLLDNTPTVLSLGRLCEDHGYTHHWISGQARVARNHISSRKVRKFIATNQIMYHSSYLVYPRVSLPHQLLPHLHRRKL